MCETYLAMCTSLVALQKMSTFSVANESFVCLFVCLLLSICMLFIFVGLGCRIKGYPLDNDLTLPNDISKEVTK